MTELSRSAQAVLNAAEDAYGINYSEFHCCADRVAAAALRAAADQAENVHPVNPSTEWGEGWLKGIQDVVAGLRRIATELEGANDH